MSEPYIAIQTIMMPKDTNRHGTIFGGVLLSNIDLAAAIAAQREIQLRGGNPRASVVTVAMNRVEFKRPVLVGDVVRFETRIVRIGRTSITVHVDVIAERGAETIPVTEAEAVFVGVDLSTPDRKPVPLFPDRSTDPPPPSGCAGA
jgi:acyl-CoA thioesterase YciA